MTTQWRVTTQYLANQLTFTRGSVADITYAGVWHTQSPTAVPALTDFVQAEVVDGTGDNPPVLAEAGKVDVVSLVGPRGGINLTPGDWQRWVRISTADEDLIFKVDMVTIQ